MKYKCIIENIEDEDEVTVRIGNVSLTGFVNEGIKNAVGESTEVDIEFYDDIEIFGTDIHDKKIEKKGKSFSSIIYGILDIERAVINSVIEFELDRDLLYDYGYLDGKYVQLNIMRMDFVFE